MDAIIITLLTRAFELLNYTYFYALGARVECSCFDRPTQYKYTQ